MAGNFLGKSLGFPLDEPKEMKDKNNNKKIMFAGRIRVEMGGQIFLQGKAKIVVLSCRSRTGRGRTPGASAVRIGIWMEKNQNKILQ